MMCAKTGNMMAAGKTWADTQECVHL